MRYNELEIFECNYLSASFQTTFVNTPEITFSHKTLYTKILSCSSKLTKTKLYNTMCCFYIFCECYALMIQIITKFKFIYTKLRKGVSFVNYVV